MTSGHKGATIVPKAPVIRWSGLEYEVVPTSLLLPGRDIEPAAGPRAPRRQACPIDPLAGNAETGTSWITASRVVGIGTRTLL